MQSKLVPLTLEASPQLIQDILDACTTASNYWAAFGVEEGFLTEPDAHGIRHYRRIKVYEYGDEDKAISETVIGPDEIATGVRRIMLNDMVQDGKPIRESHALCSKHTRADLFQALIDPEHDIDTAWTVDAVIQAAALGRIVYG